QIQKIRFGNRLHVSFFVDEDLLDELTIPFLLQTLVENAFKHGVESIEDSSLLTISITAENARVVVKVIDEGPGFSSEDDIKLGTGLKNIKERLQLIYGQAAGLSLKNNGEKNGATVSVSWPKEFVEN